MTEIRVGLLGLGTIGTGVASLLCEHRDLLSGRLGKPLKLVRVCDRDETRGKDLDLTGIDRSYDANEVIEADDIDIVIELIGGYEPARSFVATAIEHGKHVVTANKALIAKHGEELFQQAAAKGVAIGFEAAVGGGIPCLKALREGLAANVVQSVYGILNGTCNYILTKMEHEGLSFETVLAQAQELGYAEADPTFDIEGVDTAHKLAILAAMAFGAKIKFDDVFTEGISRITPDDIASAKELGYRIKLLGIAKPHDGSVEMRVHPTLVPLEAQIAQVSDSYNAVQVSGDYVEHAMYFGRGAGERPTASAVVADVMDIARAMPDGIGYLASPMGTPQAMRRDLPTCPMEDVRSEYYLRLMVKDQPGVLAAVTRILGENGISIEAFIQKERHRTQAVPVVLLTHVVREGALKAALEAIVALPSVEGDTLMLRIERFGA